jgi:N-acetyl-anhydromuramyl-L-alanine amidase AmpD
MRDIKEIVVHCTFTGDEDVTVRDLDRKHRQAGWNMVGYHYVIRRSGELQAGRPLEKAGAHVPGFNKYSIGVCLSGGSPANNFTAAQMETLRDLLQQLTSKFPDAKVIGHRDLPRTNTTCPTFDVSAWWQTAASRIDVV